MNRQKISVVWCCCFGVAGFLLNACSAKQKQSEITFETEPRAPLAAQSLSPTRSPQIAVSAAGTISMLALYTDAGAPRVGFTMSHDGGDHFMPVKALSEAGAAISAHGENNPMMVTAGRGVYALWEQTAAGSGADREIVVARSTNEGMSFEKPVRVNDNKTASFHGFASIAADAKGNVYVVWLDGRDSPESPGTFDVYLARSSDRGATFAANTRVARSACPCCRPNVTIGKNGEVFVVWRKVFPGSIRDMVVSISKDGGQTFPQQARVSEDDWQIEGCPESGAAIVEVGDRLYVAWMTAGKDAHAQIKVASSSDQGAHFADVRVASAKIGEPNHPSFARGPNGALLLCFQGRGASQDGKKWSAAATFMEDVASGQGGPAALANSGQSVSYPSAAISPTGSVFVAWSATDEAKGTSVNLLRGSRQ